ncbi:MULTISPECIES: sensor domain-containing protein [Streptomyces]|uniref:Sensor domain-containing protein n=1 Tax=Streptomyces sudanensis TaxID=436397 RepID=A0ABY4TCQ5_9ACTN|nr:MULTISPECIES: sensor domain-containing protein [Streptomyces]URN16010.1 sensor domain-containing protein [Streptomyces sudanensis]
MRIRTYRGTVVALTASALLLTAACGGPSDGKDGGGGPDGGRGTGQKPASAPLTEAQMKAGLLEAGDLPAGWKVGTTMPAEGRPKAEKPECQPLATLMSAEVEGTTKGGERDFRGPGDSVLAQMVLTYPDRAGAAAFVKGLDGAVGRCRSFTTVQDGRRMSVAAEELTAPKVGEEAFAVRLTMDIPQLGMVLKTDVLVARQGAGITRLGYLPGAEPDPAAFEDLAKRGGDKFAEGARS